MSFGFSRMSIGAKITLVVSSVIVLFMIIMMFVIINRVTASQNMLINDLIKSAASNVAKISNAIFDETYVSVESAQANIEDDITHDSDVITIRNEVIAMVDSSRYAHFGYVYLNQKGMEENPHFSTNKAENSQYKLRDGGFMIFVRDNDVSTQKDLTVLPASETVMRFGSVQKALQTGQPTIGNPSYQTIDGKTYFCTGINIPLRNSRGEIIGLIGLVVDLKNLNSILQNHNLSYFDNDYRVLLSESHIIASHANGELIGKTFDEINPGTHAKTLLSHVKNKENGVYEYENYSGVKATTGIETFEVGYNTGIYWTAMIIAPTDSIYAPIKQLRFVIIVCILISLFFLVVFILYYIKRNLSQRIVHILDHLQSFFKYIRH
ncbi:hypothetical protein OQH60_08430, partial [Campylobacter sp. MIT 21-1685]|uniref:hypothetical protein n=1 Tax=unclassified Campylobacter TaxID=2593542 RepID=UPI00224B7303